MDDNSWVVEQAPALSDLLPGPDGRKGGERQRSDFTVAPWHLYHVLVHGRASSEMCKVNTDLRVCVWRGIVC